MGTEQAMEIWLHENRHQMVSCPYQPGGLRISKRACIRRYETAKVRGSNSEAGRARMKTVFEEIVKTGLSRCLSCPIGRELSGCEA
jgi:hypothetical protein